MKTLTAAVALLLAGSVQGAAVEFNYNENGKDWGTASPECASTNEW